MELIKKAKYKIKNSYTIKMFIVTSVILAIFAVLSITKVSIFNKIEFCIFGIWCLLFLMLSISSVMKICNIKLDKNKKIIISIILALCFFIYFFTLLNTKQIYTWDQKIYYGKQIDLLYKFKNNFFSGIKHIISSTYQEDYGEFLLVFTSFIFNFTSKTEKMFILVICCTEILPIIFTALLIVNQIIEKFNFKHGNKIFILSGILLISFPLLHQAALTGQPDIFGLFWINLIILLTMNYDFQDRDFARWTMIIIFTFLLSITRRWYIFWIIGYYLSYALIILFATLVSKDKEKIKNLIKNSLIFILYAGFILIIALFPIIKRTILANYVTAYSAWNVSGLKGEIIHQLHYVGLLAIILMLVSIIYIFINKKTIIFTLQIILTYLITIVTFTRIQNMGLHQSLILVPEYLLLMVLGISALCQTKNKIINNIITFIIGIYIFTSFLGSYTENKNIYKNTFFSYISLKPIQRLDYEKIGKIVQFIQDNCDTQKDKIYVNAANVSYCGDTIAFYNMPYNDLRKVVIYESSIDSVHGFPIDLFKAKYVFTTNNIIESTGATSGHIITNIKYGIEKDKIINQYYKKIKEFDLENGIIFYAYERIKKVDELEINEWKELFKEQTNLYPKKFGDRLDSYLKME